MNTRKLNEGSLVQSRRRFLISWLSMGWLAFFGATVGMAAAGLRFMFPNVSFEPPQQFRAGFPDEYPVGDVSQRWKNDHGVWLVRTESKMYALLATCTHLGCTPNWLEGEQRFKCPCHGSGFNRAGVNLEGPAPRPLDRCAISLAANGEVVIDKARKFQYEKGEWDDPASFLVV